MKKYYFTFFLFLRFEKKYTIGICVSESSSFYIISSTPIPLKVIFLQLSNEII